MEKKLSKSKLLAGEYVLEFNAWRGVKLKDAPPRAMATLARFLRNEAKDSRGIWSHSKDFLDNYDLFMKMKK